MRRTASAAVCTLLAGVPFALANAAETAPCPLKEVGSLDLVLRHNDSYNVPVHLDDQPMVMTIDTGSTGTSITVATAKKLGLDVTPVQDARMFLNDIKINSSVNLKSFGLGDIELDDMPVWVLPDQLVDKGIAGLIGADTLKSFDVEFDPAHSKFNFGD
jgi:predicted aspartyl protease